MSEMPTDAGLSSHHIIASVEASLRRLATDYIDLLQFHLPDPYTPWEETIGALDNLVTRGLIRYSRFCNFPAWQAASIFTMQRERNYAAFVSAQLYYSLLNRDIELDLVPFALKNNLAIFPWGPLAGGFLSGKYTRE